MRRLTWVCPVLLLSGVVATASAAPAGLPDRIDVTIRRPGQKAYHVHLELLTSEGKTRVLGCQTAKQGKRCRKRTKIPFTEAQLAETKKLWSAFAKQGPCLLRRVSESWGKIWIKTKTKDFSGPMVPSRDHKTIESKCYRHAKLGWWLLDRYDRRK